MPVLSSAHRALARHRALKDSLRRGAPLVSQFIKSASPSVIEALEGCGYDFIILDAEHNPYGRAAMDQCLLAARSIGLPALVRIPNHRSDTILSVLDMGAAGIIAPHVGSAHSVSEIVGACKYHGGTRGVTSRHRAGGYGNYPLADYLSDSDDAVIIIAQIEDSAGVQAVDDICATTNLDGLLVGPVDLRHSLGSDPEGKSFEEAVEAVLNACNTHSKAAGLFVPTGADVPKAQGQGFSVFAISSDLSVLRTAAKLDVKAAKNRLA